MSASKAVPLKLKDDVVGLPPLIHCPECDDNYVHMTGRRYLEDGNDSSATRSGDVVRGDVLAIEFECEGGHKFEVCFGFHKGNTVAFCRPPA